MPSAERLAALARVLRTTPEWLLGRPMSASPELTSQLRSPSRAFNDFRGLPRDLPIYGTALGADLGFLGPDGTNVAIEQTELNMSGAMDYMTRPQMLLGNRDAYVLTVIGYSMFPRFEPGRRVLLNPKIQPMLGDDVAVQLKRPLGDEGDAEISCVLLKRLVRRRPDALVLYQFQNDLTFEVPMDLVHAIHRVQPWDDALGF